MAKRKYFQKRARSKKQFTIPLAVVGGFMPLAADVIQQYQTGSTWQGIATNAVRDLTGWDNYSRTWSFGNMKEGLIPIVIGLIAHKVAGKIGINRALSSAGIPWVRI